MHCLGAVAGTTKSSSMLSDGQGGNCGSVLSVVRALGVLVCEGRIQGPPRGYKEGPHCVAPLHGETNNHECEKDNYLCNRYIVLVREIAERVSIGTNLCIEVVMCNDCPCGLSTATRINPISSIPSTLITQWSSHTSEMLLEYWCIGIVSSNANEIMNSQGLYQAVRSRLHFSQVAAWWSRSNGTKPKYIATRLVPYSSNGENFKKFSDVPVEHTFPLASIGDGNSIKVTVWALPRMQDIPELKCPLHPSIDIKEDDGVARALTPTKNITLTHASEQQQTSLVLPTLVDDRLQTPCNKPGKHHCHCEEEETSGPPSPTIKTNGERKRRRSLPCGPHDSSTNGHLLASVGEKTCSSGSFSPTRPLVLTNSLINKNHNNNCNNKNNNNSNNNKKNYNGNNINNNDQEDSRRAPSSSCTYLSNGTLERYFWTRVNLDEAEINNEKRYKPSSDVNNYQINPQPLKLQSFVPFNKKDFHHKSIQDTSLLNQPNLVINPFHDPNPGPSVVRKQETTSLPCTVHMNYSTKQTKKLSTQSISHKYDKNDEKYLSGDLTQLMSKLSFPKDGSKIKEDGGSILNWISKVPGRVLNSTPNTSIATEASEVPVSSKAKEQRNSINDQSEKVISNSVKLKNCSLELSQREFDEVLAVLRARTPSGRKRTPVKILGRREKLERYNQDYDSEKNESNCPINRDLKKNSNIIQNCQCRTYKKLNQQMDSNKITNYSEDSKNCIQNGSNKADVLLGAILRTSKDRRGLMDISNSSMRSQNHDTVQKNQVITMDVRSNSRDIQIDDDKFLSLALNKRLHRLKQLFKKEQEKNNSSDIKNTSHKITSSSHLINKNENFKDNNYIRVKRKIDFSKNEPPYKPLINIPVHLIYRNSSKDSTNYKINKDFNHHEASETDSSSGSSSSSSSCGSVPCINHESNEQIHNGLKINCKSDYNESEDDEDIITDDSNNNENNDDEEDEDDDDDDDDDEENVEENVKNNKRDGNYCEEEEIGDNRVPSAIEQERFRRSLENAASMVFHSRTGLPLTSSPAPLRRGSCCFDYDSTLNTVSSKRSALFELNTPPSPGAVSLEETDREIDNSHESDEQIIKRSSFTRRNRPQSHALLGSFEESALNGRLEPVSTVHGFTAEIGASGSFCPKHRKLPVTVFFYTLGDNDKVSSPYLAHINLGKKGYQVPRSGTIQVTLLNPLGTVVKMFVVLYDLSDMPPRSHTFLRQRTLRDKTLRYLIHLRFMSGKSGRIYLHTDIRMIICRKSDVDTASDFGSEPPKELRSYIHGPTNPKFSPRC